MVVVKQMIYQIRINFLIINITKSMSKQNEDLQDDFSEDYEINSDLTQDNNQNNSNPINFNQSFLSNPMDMDDMGSFGGGKGRMRGGFGGMSGLGGFGMGGGFGGMGGFGQGRFGGNIFGDHGSFGHHGAFPGEGLFGTGQKQKKNDDLKVQQPKQPEQPQESEEQKLARLTKKKDVPLHEQITLVDWAIRGPAEIIRMVLEFILIPYKQRKYVFVTKDKWFKQDKPKLEKDHPGIQLPYLQDGQKIIYGTQAILTYILHKYQRTELLGKTPDEKVRIATASSIFWQFIQDYYELVYGEYDESLNWQKAQERYVNQKFRVHMFKMVTYLRQTSNISSSSDFNWVDFGIADMVTVLNQMHKRFKQQNSNVQNYSNRILSLPQFIVYRRSDRYHERPFNGLGSIWK